MSVFTRNAEALLVQKGQNNSKLPTSSNKRIVYPAIVRDTNDLAGLNRIKAEIVDIDDKGNIIPGKDRIISKQNVGENDLIDYSNLPICIPLLPEFVHARPQIGECVYIIAENPDELSSPRFWLGPSITTQLNLPFQPYQESMAIFNSASFNTPNNYNGATLQKQTKQFTVLPSKSEIALQGRKDADVILRPREVLIVAGKFQSNSINELNTDRPCKISLKQIDYSPYTTGIKTADQKLNEDFKPYSQLNFEATSINFISNEGKLRELDQNSEEAKANPRLKDYGDIANQLHPAVFGDELIKLLKLIIQYLLTHIHTPQKPGLNNNISSQLEPYLNSGKMNDLLSNVIRLS